MTRAGDNKGGTEITTSRVGEDVLARGYRESCQKMRCSVIKLDKGSLI